MLVLLRGQGMNATGTGSACMSPVATSGHTVPAASESRLTRSTCPAALSTGSRRSFQRSSLPNSVARSHECEYLLYRKPRPLALLWPAITKTSPTPT